MRRVLKRREIVADDWRHFGEEPAAHEAQGLIVALAELRAVGAAVKRDLIFALARCGFDAFEVAPGEDLEECARALGRYTVAYQPGAPDSLSLRQRYSA